MRAFFISVLLAASLAGQLHAQTAPDTQIEMRASQGDPLALWQLGDFYRRRGAEGDGERTLEYFRRSLPLFQKEDGPAGVRVPLIQAEIAEAYFVLGRYDEAKAARLDQIEILRSAADPSSEDLAFALHRLSVTERHRADHRTAIEAEHISRDLYRHLYGDDSSQVAATWYEEGLNHHHLMDHDAALAAYGEAATRYRAIGPDAEPSLVDTLSNVTGIFAYRKQLRESLPSRSEEITILRRIEPGKNRLAAALSGIGLAWRELGFHALSLAAYKEAKSIYAVTEGDRTADAAIAEHNEGVAWFNLKQTDRALDIYLAAAARYRAAARKSPSDFAILLANIASLLDERKRTRETVAIREEHAAILRETMPGTRELGDSLDGLAFAHFENADYQRSLTIVEEEIAVYREAGHAPGIPIALSRRGVAWQMLKDNAKALEAYRASLALERTAAEPDRANIAITLSNVSLLANALGRYAEAEKAGQEMVAILRETSPDTVELANALSSLAMTYNHLVRPAKSLPLVEEARQIYIRQRGEISWDVAQSWNLEGQSLRAAERNEEAIAAYGKSSDLFRRASGPDAVDIAYVLNNAAWAHRHLGNFDRAYDDFKRAAEIMEKEHGPTHAFPNIAYLNIGVMSQLRGNYDEAIRWSMKALTNVLRHRDETLEEQRWIYDTLSRSFKGRGDVKRAILFAKLAINAQQEVRAFNKSYTAEEMEGFNKEWRMLYENLADLLILEGRLSEAQAVFNMQKEEELVDFVERDASADLLETRAALTQKEETEQTGIDALLVRPIAAAAAVARLAQRDETNSLTDDEEAQLKVLEASLDQAYSGFMEDVDAFLEQASAEGGDVQREIDAINLDYTADNQEALRAFDGRAAMLQAASLGEATHLFLTVPEASIHKEMAIERARLSRLVFEALSAIERRDPKAVEKLQALHRVLIEPIRDDLETSGATTLMLNLQGFLRYVPFAALHDGKRFLVEDYALAIFTPAAQTEFRAAERAPEKSAGFGVTAKHPGFSPLPGVAREIDAIFARGTLTGAANLDAKFTRDALRDALKARPAIVHIASHFKLVPGRETDSFLLLGDGSPLSLSDIRKGRGFRFGGVDLLTLSACQTARGGDSDGGEVESFGALAQMNGASAVMATLWPVADDATAGMMQAFYANFVGGGMDKAEALRAAQIAMIRGGGTAGTVERGAKSLRDRPAAAVGHAHPYFWSPFILMGNWL